MKKQKSGVKDSHASKETEKEVKKRTKGRFLGWIQDYGGEKRHENNEKAKGKPIEKKNNRRKIECKERRYHKR